MKPRAIYNAQGWVLCRCMKCSRANYVEPHGTTASCPTCKTETEHASIPFSERNAAGTVWLGKRRQS